MPIVPLAQAGKYLDPPVTRQAVQAWVRQGCPTTPDGKIDTDAAQRWRLTYKGDPDCPTGRGGRRQGAGRPPGTPTNGTTNEPASHAGTAAPNGETPGAATGTLAEIKRQQEALKLLAMQRAEQQAAGTLVDAAEAERALRAAAMDARAKLDEIAARASRRIVEELQLAAELVLPIRAMLNAEVDHACRAITGLITGPTGPTNDHYPHPRPADDPRPADAGGA